MIIHPLNPEQPLKLALFDLDGTLVDSAPDLALAIDRLLRDRHYAEAGEKRVRQWVGNGAAVLVRRALAHAQGLAEEAVEEALLASALDDFLSFYEEDCTQHSVLYPGALELLSHWQNAGVRMAIVTNKPARFTPALLEHCGIAEFFSDILCGDSLPRRKPAPDPLLAVLKNHAVPASQALMIGDSRNDIQAAKAAGIPVVAVSYGYNHGAPIESEGADRVIHSLTELISR